MLVAERYFRRSDLLFPRHVVPLSPAGPHRAAEGYIGFSVQVLTQRCAEMLFANISPPPAPLCG